MSSMRQVQAISMRPLVLLALMVAAPSLVFAQGGSVKLPENARAKSYGGGWECERGYREDNGVCAAIRIPANAYLTNKS